jgi:hypothetical protein
MKKRLAARGRPAPLGFSQDEVERRKWKLWGESIFFIGVVEK